MKVGDIIRRKCSTDGKPIGPYMRVMVIKDDRVYADTIGEDEPNIIILKRNCYVCKVRILVVSEEVLNNLKSGKQYAVQHPVCKLWDNMVENTPDLIVFKTAVKGYTAMFVVENVRRALNLGEPIIRVVVNYKVE